MKPTEPDPPAGQSLTRGYQPAPGVYDEMLEPGGILRSHWESLASLLGGVTPEELSARSESVRRLVREHGVTHTAHAEADGRGRPWSLDLLPLLIRPEDWRQLEAGLVQRARLLNLILADIYGPQQLVREGLLPPALVYANPAFLRPCCGFSPVGGRFLVLYAMDLARAPDGSWRVLADRTQAPAGAGYTLENRLILSRVLPNEFRTNPVQRLAGFFQALRDTLSQLAPRGTQDPNVVLLTPGPYNETYFEHVFLARYLGFPLVEGGDLTVRDHRVYLKTLEGLRPVEVILRRVDDALCDPLDLRANSTLGVPGLVHAARAGHVGLANALGSGAIETPALPGFLPSLCRRLLHEELALPSLATWWCGEDGAFAHVREHLPELVIRRAFAPASAEGVFGSRLDSAAREALLESIHAAPGDFVGQEQPALSAAPVWERGGLEPRSVVLRAFVCATADGFAVMPGALTRFAGSPDRLIVSTQNEGGSKDTWVLADGPVNTLSLLKPAPKVIRLERSAMEVPSRVADNLFWLGRYIERLEDIVRVLRCLLGRLTAETGAEETPELTALIRLLVDLDVLPARLRQAGRLAGVEREIYLLIYQTHRLGTIPEVAGRLRNLAFLLRERFSADTWSILSKLQVRAQARPGRVRAAEALALLDALIADLAAFSGMEMENMTRGHAWRFLDVGRRLERSVNIVTLVRGALNLSGHSTVLDAVLEVADSVMTYRRFYLVQPQWPGVLDLLLADDSNPRSLAFQVNALADHAANLPREAGGAGMDHPSLQIAAFRALLQQTDWQSLSPASAQEPAVAAIALLDRFSGSLRGVSDGITHLYFSHAETRVS